MLRSLTSRICGIKSITHINSSRKLLKANSFQHIPCCCSYSTDPNKGSSSKFLLIGTFGTMVLITGSIVYMKNNFKENKEKEKIERAKKSLQQVAIGGDFDLIDQKGDRRRNEDFHGQWLILYFGFVHCPTICPEQLIKMMEIVDSVDNAKGNPGVIPIFITVDPARDNPAMLEKYLKEFSPKLIGLTGSQEDIKSVTKKFKIFASQLQPDTTGNYDIDHSIIMYLLSPDGEYVTHFGQNSTPQEASVKIIKHMKDYALLHKS